MSSTPSNPALRARKGVLVLFAAAFSVGFTQTEQTLWIDAADLSGPAAALKRAGQYAVWAWAPVSTAADVTVAEKKLSGQFSGRSNADYAWVELGHVELPAGELPLFLGKGVASIALSAAPGFDPRRAVKHLRVLNSPEAVDDRRTRVERHTDTVFMMRRFDSAADWEAHAEVLRRRILVSSGLWPVPQRFPLHERVFDPVEHDDYITEKVIFEAHPGFFVTGNLFRPKGDGPFPAVLCPHGHWADGRLEDTDRASVPGRAITFARMGIVALTVDMLGYNDSRQLEHRWNNPLWKLWGVHPFAVQLWSNIRAVDFLESLPYVDRERIACTGASGGGTQTFALTAVDRRIKVAAPVNMISSTMQGGCVCENAPLLRIHDSNMEIGALTAPRPLLLVSATGDWTRETPRVEFPAIRSVYDLYGAGDRIENVHLDAPHNFNRQSREAVYRFFGKWLLNQPELYANFEEPPFEVGPKHTLRLFPDDTLPEHMPTGQAVIDSWIARNRETIDNALPADFALLPPFQEQFRPLFQILFDAAPPDPANIGGERHGYDEFPEFGYLVERWIIGRQGIGDAVPLVLYRPLDAERRDAVIIVHGRGKAALAQIDANRPGELVERLLEAGHAVLTIDAFFTGEHRDPFRRTERRRRGAFHDTFNPTDTACRVQDVLTAAAFVRARRDFSGVVDLVGLEDGGFWCLFAAALDTGIASTVIDWDRFDAEDDAQWAERFYVPSIRALGDVTTAAALIAPRRLTVFNIDGFPAVRVAPFFREHGTFRGLAKAPSVDELIKVLR